MFSGYSFSFLGIAASITYHYWVWQPAQIADQRAKLAVVDCQAVIQARKWDEVMALCRLTVGLEYGIPIFGPDESKTLLIALFSTDDAFPPNDAAGSPLQYLIEAYGMGSFGQVYASGDYQLNYGKSLDALVLDWRAEMERTSNEIVMPESTRPSDVTGRARSEYLRLFSGFTGTREQFLCYQVLDRARIELLQSHWAEVM